MSPGRQIPASAEVFSNGKHRDTSMLDLDVSGTVELGLVTVGNHALFGLVYPVGDGLKTAGRIPLRSIATMTDSCVVSNDLDEGAVLG
jgi:hypothetical protein